MLREVWPFVDGHRRSGRPVVLARLVGRDGPGSRPLGATLAVAGDGSWRGSISGGCVEGIVLDTARDVLTGAPPRVMEVVPGEQVLPWEDAPVCAAVLQVLVVPAPDEPVHASITAALAANRPFTVGVGLVAPHLWSLGDSASGFVEVVPARPRLVVVGATDLAAALALVADAAGRAVVVIDPRPGHASSGAFARSVELVRSWPDEWISRAGLGPGDAVVAVSHDPRIDDRAVRAALAADVGHVAVLGSRATHAQRLERLAGIAGVERLVGPAGLDLGGTSIGETAVSIVAELVAVGNGRAGGRLRDAATSIRAVQDDVMTP